MNEVEGHRYCHQALENIPLDGIGEVGSPYLY